MILGPATLGLLNLLGGVILLLWGLRMVRTAAMRALGGRLKRIIGRAAGNRFSAFSTGMALTAVVQSSTAVVLLLSSLASRGVVPLSTALAMVLGADVGTTLIAQLLSLNVSFLSPLCLIIGFAVFQTSNSLEGKNAGRAMLGIGLMLSSLTLIVSTTGPMRESEVIHGLINSMVNEPILALVVAALLTWLSHSSLAMILLVMALVQSDQLPVELIYLLVLGINVGGALPALTASLGEAPAGRRVALGNLIFRLGGLLLTLPILPICIDYVSSLEPDLSRQVVNFHMFFNVGVACIFLFLTAAVARLATTLVSGRLSDPNAKKLQPIYLNNKHLDSPPLALSNATRETLRMGNLVYEMLESSAMAFNRHDVTLVQHIDHINTGVDHLNETITNYLTKIRREELSEAESDKCMAIFNYVTNLEHVGDIVDKNLLALAAKKRAKGLTFSIEGEAEIALLHDRLLSNFKLSLDIFYTLNKDLASQLLKEEDLFLKKEQHATQQHLNRLSKGYQDSIETSTIHLDLLRDFKRMNAHISSISYFILRYES